MEIKALNTLGDGSEELNKQQEKVLQLIGTWSGPDLPRPSLLAETMGLAGESSVRAILKPLEAKGYVERVPLGSGLPKLPRLTDKGRAAIGLSTPDLKVAKHGPIPVYPPVHGGSCGVQYDEPVRYVRQLSDIFPLRDDEYFLTVVGECMDGGSEPIKPGDMILMRPCSRINRPCNGQVVHVEVNVSGPGDTEPLLREYWFDPKTGRVTLKTRNPDYPNATYPDDEVDPRGILLSIIHTVQAPPTKS
ncbi:MAG TPA: S24 family peptidase [Abditibacteriaceae bacterium]|jgi:SOS-response transcriptional repressor LexA